MRRLGLALLCLLLFAASAQAQLISGGAAGGGGGSFTGSGTTNFLPLLTGPTALGNSLLYQDTVNLNLLSTTLASAEAAAMASFVALPSILGSLVANREFAISGLGGFATIDFLALNGTYTTPTKTLANDVIGIIDTLAYTGAPGFVRGPTITFTALTDADAASPFYRLDILGNSALDTIRIGVAATPEIVVTNGLATINGTLNATVAYQANGTPGITQDFVVCTGAVCATSCTLSFQFGLLKGSSGTCP